MATKTQLAGAHILRQLKRCRMNAPALTTHQPLFVAIQGPQGSGKTYLTSQLCDSLSSPPHSLSVVALSLDDLYLPHLDLISLAESNQENALLQGRGHPGTHDVELGKALMHDLRHINDGPSADAHRRVLLPMYDKSLHDGAGDRSQNVVEVAPPVDVVVLEGWCAGFFPITLQEVERRWAERIKDVANRASMLRYRKEDVLQLNKLLEPYVELWDYFNVFIQIKAIDSSPYSIIHKWRLEQEHQMKSHNGGRGMDDNQVRSFVDRYIPGYIFFGDSMVRTERRGPSWRGNGMAITVGEARELLGVEYF